MLTRDIRKVALVGTGMVGMSYAYALLNQNACDELVLVDIDKTRAAGEAMDLNHGLAFSGSHMRIIAGDYGDCGDADIAVLCAGVAQRPGETRPQLLDRNAEVFRSIIGPVLESGFRGIFLVATNPVDIMARITRRLSGFDAAHVIGTGTTLDSARLRYLLGQMIGVDPRNVHAYVMGEHGDTEFVPWSQAMIGTKSVESICAEMKGRICDDDLSMLEEDVRSAGYKIIQAKKATYYGIGMALLRITRAIFGDENSILTVSTQLRGEYGMQDVYAGVPCVVGRGGATRILELALRPEELAKLQASCEALKALYGQLQFDKK